MGKKPIAHLRVYKGTELNYDSSGKIKNENQSVKIEHNTIGWANFLKYLKPNQFIKVEVERVLDGETFKEIKDIEPFKEEVAAAFSPVKKEVLTADQKRIAELEKKIDQLAGGNKPKDEDDELTKARTEYVKVFGKKGHHSWSVEQIKEKIAEKE